MVILLFGSPFDLDLLGRDYGLRLQLRKNSLFDMFIRILAGCLPGQPPVGLELSQSRSLGGIVTEQALEEVFAIVR